MASTGNTLPPAGPPSPRSTNPARGRRGPWLILVSGLVLVGAVAAGGAWVANYEPLRWEFASSPPRGSDDLGSFTSPHQDSFQAVGVTCHAGRPVTFGFTLYNQGSIGITVTQLFTAGRAYAGDLLTFQDPRIGPGSGTDNHLMNGRLEPFRPFSLAPHHFRRIAISAVMHRCEGGVLSVSSTEMVFRVLGFTRHQEVYFPFTLNWSRSGTEAG
jgi:hypothetical protein